MDSVQGEEALQVQEHVVLPCREQLSLRNFMKVPPCHSRRETRAEEASRANGVCILNDLRERQWTRNRFTGGESDDSAQDEM
jgi:hypothetical protein